ncbi:hypothetical protein HNY73_015840 [Argiope bruennichi]|uniref:Uncharacterized protein n=1 Tax=Argiope bruennichi TaxID=94029 RepID=A0A8T0EH10_ARGBR|nr:hypothetical protein HNY73_015840 [Argiope bruennichi]
MAKDVFFVSVGVFHLSYTAVKVYKAFNGDFPSVSSITGYVRNIFKTDEPDMQLLTKRDSDLQRKDDLRLDITSSMISSNNENDFDEKLIVGSFTILFGLITVVDFFFLKDLTRLN